MPKNQGAKSLIGAQRGVRRTVASLMKRVGFLNSGTPAELSQATILSREFQQLRQHVIKGNTVGIEECLNPNRRAIKERLELDSHYPTELATIKELIHRIPDQQREEVEKLLEQDAQHARQLMFNLHHGEGTTPRKTTMIDYLGKRSLRNPTGIRVFKEITLFQYALAVGDWEMIGLFWEHLRPEEALAQLIEFENRPDITMRNDGTPELSFYSGLDAYDVYLQNFDAWIQNGNLRAKLLQMDKIGSGQSRFEPHVIYRMCEDGNNFSWELQDVQQKVTRYPRHLERFNKIRPAVRGRPWGGAVQGPGTGGRVDHDYTVLVRLQSDFINNYTNLRAQLSQAVSSEPTELQVRLGQ